MRASERGAAHNGCGWSTFKKMQQVASYARPLASMVQGSRAKCRVSAGKGRAAILRLTLGALGNVTGYKQ
jgi:hypothetical protein